VFFEPVDGETHRHRGKLLRVLGLKGVSFIRNLLLGATLCL
jgi:hypothetical protein